MHKSKLILLGTTALMLMGCSSQPVYRKLRRTDVYEEVLAVYQNGNYQGEFYASDYQTVKYKGDSSNFYVTIIVDYTKSYNMGLEYKTKRTTYEWHGDVSWKIVKVSYTK